jgi:bifunctional non-homologous end joining protein LigD
MIDKSITLYCQENGSDKLYKTEVVKEASGFSVRCWWGPRTGTLQAGTKTKEPVPHDEALKVWEKLVREKKAKGYHEGEDAPAYTVSDGPTKDTGLRPMLLTPASIEDAERFLEDREWCGQEKLNGKRIMIRAKKGQVVAANRRGLECAIPREIASVLGRFNVVLDGEMVGSTYVPFDLLEAEGKDYRPEGYSLRYHVLHNLLSESKVKPIPCVATPASKRQLLETLQKRNAEGIVFKKLEGVGYLPGKVENLARAHAVKVKFWRSGEFVVLGWNGDRQSVSLGAHDAQGKVIPVGNVTVAPKHAWEVEVNRVIQVRYLYATSGDQLYQPSLDDSSGSVWRKDKTPAECRIDQLIYEGQE